MTSKFEMSGATVTWNPIPQGTAGTFSAPVPTERGKQPYRLAKWKGEPGKYDRPAGMPWSETFVVYKGRGRVRDGDEVVEFSPGVVIELRKGVPYVLEIDETLEKFAVITTE
ncbi:cupin domain-containing protein [Ramlibacter sp.]|uniref:cupin domain-containing protein n=1 Tax=Ramlibacter sp. TaxID=1917967 RepID=UPI003D0B9479